MTQGLSFDWDGSFGGEPLVEDALNSAKILNLDTSILYAHFVIGNRDYLLICRTFFGYESFGQSPPNTLSQETIMDYQKAVR